MRDGVARRAVGMVNYHATHGGHGNLYNGDIGLRFWRSRHARVRSGTLTTPIDISVIGDSITEGRGAGGGTGITYANWQDSSYTGRLRISLAAKYGDVGKGLVPVYTPTGGTPYWALSGTWAAEVYGNAAISNSTAQIGATATFTFVGTGVGIIYTKGANAGTFSYSIDGGTAVNVNANNATTSTAKVESAAVANGAHTVVITHVSGTKTYIAGGYAIKGTTGIRVHNCGRAAALASAFTSGFALDVAISMFASPLTIISLTANDYESQTSLATYKANLQTIMTRGKAFGDVLFVSSGLRTLSGTTIPQSDYVQTMYDLAIANDCAYLDLFNRWKADYNYVNTTLGMMMDTVHPNDYGHQDMSTAILKVIDEY